MRGLCGLIVIALILVSCRVTVSNAPAASPSAAPSATSVSDVASDTPTPESEADDSAALEGRLIFADDFRGVMVYDFATGEVTTLFEPESGALTRTLAASPDGSQVLIQYAPPPPEDDMMQFGFTDLYIMPSDGSAEPEPFLQGEPGEEIYYLPSWSPDGQYVYYSHIVPDPDEEGASRRQLERIAYPQGEPEVLVINAFSPQLSSDGTKMVYVVYDEDTQRDEVVIANLDGSEPLVLLENNLFSAIDAPAFSPDDSLVLFSAVTSDQEGSNSQPSLVMAFMDLLLGVRRARAHSVPSDIWVVPSSGGRATQITRLYGVNLWPAFSPDGEKLALLSNIRIYLMDPDGGNVVTLLDEGASGTMSWVP